jgi:hypothetical protein
MITDYISHALLQSLALASAAHTVPLRPLQHAFATMRLYLFASLVLPFTAFASTHQQIPLGSSQMPEAYTPLTNAQPTLADLLTIEPSASIFYSYARELELSARFANVDTQSTLLVPTNKAVMALARKP